jgi:hypothetical protein
MTSYWSGRPAVGRVSPNCLGDHTRFSRIIRFRTGLQVRGDHERCDTRIGVYLRHRPESFVYAILPMWLSPITKTMCSAHYSRVPPTGNGHATYHMQAMALDTNGS